MLATYWPAYGHGYSYSHMHSYGGLAVLQRFGPPAAHGLGDALPLRLCLQHGQSGAAMMRGVGVQLDPAILGRVIAGHSVPGRGHVPALRTDGPAKPERGETAVHCHLGGPDRRTRR